ncbi:hypothetical protein [Bradyrhizobium sp. LA2.1]|uniref:hypothetical protein n=1 Tax=Bradyrhizobium sp. LA2.1 TaxID=3156376 RepID=UPI003393E3DE
MSDLDFSDLIPSRSSPTAAGSGDLSFEDLVPQKSNLPAAIADVPTEISNAASENIDAMKKGLTPSGQGTRGFLERSGDLARGLISIPALVASPITGAARSIGGHLMADAVQGFGENVVNPISEKMGGQAQHPDPNAVYETAKGDVDLALSGARAAAPRAPAVATPTIQELKAASNAAYSSPEVVGLEFKPGALKGYSDRTQIALNSEGFDDIVAPKTFALLQRVQNFPQGATVTGQNVNSLRKTLGKLAGSTDPTEKAAATFAIDHLDDFVPKIPRTDILKGDAAAASARLEEARGNWAAAKQAEKMDKRIAKAEMQADVSNSGMNVENRIRSQMGKIAIDEREARGLTPSEVADARKIAEGSKTQNALRATGNLLGGGGGLGAVVTGIPSGGLAPAAGFALKLLSNRMTLKQAERLSEAIRMRAPLASSTEKFGQAFANYQANSNPRTLSGVAVAARNLSNNINEPNMKASIANLLRDLQSTRQGE